MMNQYKTEILSGIGSATPATYHAPRFFLQSVDQVQERFLAEIDMSPETELLEHNLAPLCARRDISMLGLIHRVVLGKAPPQFSAHIHLADGSEFLRGWAYSFARHSKQLHDPIDGSGPRIKGRSFLALIYPYNVLPQHVVDHTTVRGFQRALQQALKRCAAARQAGWQRVLQDGARSHGATVFRKWFEANDRIEDVDNESHGC